jgi:IS4 transposase
MTRKNPRREDSGWEEEDKTLTEETETDAWPLKVKANFPIRIMGRASEVMVTDVISAIVGVRKRSVEKRRRKVMEMEGFHVGYPLLSDAFT